MSRNDYSVAQARIRDAIRGIDHARHLAGLTNLAPALAPAAVRAQIDGVDAALEAVREEIMAARDACTDAGRRGLTLCD